MYPSPAIHPQFGDALIIVDLQLDFLPGGGLAIPDGEQTIAALNRYIEYFAAQSLPIFATRDWHPPDHCSFIAQGGPWPAHCIAETDGAGFPIELRLPNTTRIISKATTKTQDAYSGFQGTDLDRLLTRQNIQRLFIGGLATDYCVLNTVKDALSLGYRTLLLQDAIRAVNSSPGDGHRAEAEMARLGAVTIILEQLR